MQFTERYAPFTNKHRFAEDRIILRRALDFYGLDLQVKQYVEEHDELGAAVVAEDFDNIAEEIADAMIMTQQFEEWLCTRYTPEELDELMQKANEWRDYKLIRLKRRIESDKQKQKEQQEG